MNKPFDGNRIIFKNAKQLIAFLLLTCQSINTMAGSSEEGKSFAEQLHSQGYRNQENVINTMQQECGQNAQNQHLQPQACELQALFDGHYDTGDKEDILKSQLAKKNNAASELSQPNQPTFGDAEKLLKEKHRFQISAESDVFKKYRAISGTVADDKSQAEFFEKGSKPVQPKSPLEDKIVRCRKGVSPALRTCVKKLVVKAIPQADLVKNVTATFTARCYNLVTFSINLKTGKINVSQCENPGPTNLSVDHPIGEPDYPARTTITLISKEHFGESGVDFRASGVNPTQGNGFTGSFTAFQPHTGRKKSHTNNKNNVRGGRYVWKVTMPQKPILQEYWVGCEDLERLQNENSCEMVFSEQQGLNKTVAVPGYEAPVTRPHWSENKEFLCGGGRDIDECESLIEQKCEQIDSKCAVLLEDKTCVEYENTFRCNVSDYQKTDGLSFNAGSLSFLPGTGQSVSEGYSAADFGEAVTGFSALTEMGKTLEDRLGGIIGDPNNPTVFRGQCRQCRVNLGSFVRDCCKLKGVLQGLLGKCNEEEKKLAMAAVKNKRCIKIEGRYCHKKVAKVCVEKRDSYCCYGSQLAKILHEIAHQQLSISMGDAKHPVCSGLTASQLSQLNFDTPFAQQKLSEILGEVQASAQEKFNRVQQAVSAAKSLQVKAVDWEKKQAEIEREVKNRAERQKQLNMTAEQKQ